MGKIVKTTDFVGKYAISQNSFITSDLQSFIDKYEIEYLYDLFGPVFADMFYADIITPYAGPVNADYKALYDPIHTSEVRSLGIKQMMLGFIYWEFSRQNPVKNTITGPVIGQNEVSGQADQVNTQIYILYNESVRTYRSIALFIELNHVTYSSMDIVHSCKSLNHWST